MSNSVFGKDDCLSMAIGDFKRPKWLLTGDAVTALANFKREYGDDLRAASIAFACQFAKHLTLLDIDAKQRPNDIVVGKTAKHELVIAVIGKSYHPIIRTEIGYSPVAFTEIFAAWRPE